MIARRKFEGASGVLVVCAVVAAVCALCASRPVLWDLLGVSHEKPYFLDLLAVLAASDAKAAGLDPYAIPAPLDPWGRPHVYGPWWLHLHRLGLGMDDAVWLGFALAGAAVCALAAALRPKGPAQVLAAALLLASPPLLLAYERGNNDLAVALLLLAAGAAGGSSAAGLAGRSALVLTSAVLKFYPVAALPMLALGRRVRPALAAMGLVLAAGGLCWWIWREDFARAYGVVPRPYTLHGYGLRLVGMTWAGQGTWPRLLSYAAPLALGVLAAAQATRLAGGFRRGLAAMSEPGARSAAWFVGGGACWVFCFLANTNFPYRAVLLVVAATAWFELWRGEDAQLRAAGRRLALLLAALLFLRLIRLWLSAFFWSDLEYAGRALLGLEHGLALGLTAVILAALAVRGWLVLRGWRSPAAN